MDPAKTQGNRSILNKDILALVRQEGEVKLVNQPEVSSPDTSGPTEATSLDMKNSVMVIQPVQEGPEKNGGQDSPMPVNTDMMTANNVVLVQTPTEATVSELTSDLGTDQLQNIQIIIDIEGNQILLKEEENQDGREILQEFEINEQNEVIDSTQSQIQKSNDAGTEQVQQTALVEQDSSNVPVLFLVRAEDGSFHNVNMEADRTQTEKVVNPVNPTGANKESASEVSPGPATEDDRPFQCDLCSATFTRLGNYTRHRMIHTIHIKDDYRYKCDVCGRMFLQRCDLKRHVLTHAGSLPYKCEHCGKGYVRKSDLVVHRRFHNNERAFPCTQCSKAFYQSGDLQRHIRHVHQRIKPLTCGHCQRKYSKEATLIRHMQTVHRDIILKSLSSKVIQPLDENKQCEISSEEILNSSCQMDISS